MDYKFEAQASLFTALKATTTFTSVTALYDTPPDNQIYPYVCVVSCSEVPHNRHGLMGSDVYLTFGIYTKPGMLGTYQRDNIHGIMKSILNMKRLTMTGTLQMAGCMHFSANAWQLGEILGINTTFKVVVHDDAATNW